jgi:hypothetical protein
MDDLSEDERKKAKKETERRPMKGSQGVTRTCENRKLASHPESLAVAFKL